MNNAVKARWVGFLGAVSLPAQNRMPAKALSRNQVEVQGATSIVRTSLRFGLILAVIALAATMIAVFPVKDHALSFLRWAEGAGIWGPVTLGALYIPASLLFLPVWMLTVGAGFTFGFSRALVAVSAGSVMGAVAAFLAGRTLLRGLIEDRVARDQRFRAIDHAVAEHGFKIVFLTRLSPVLPYNLLNYAFGVTKVGFRDFLLASWIGMLPGTAMYVYFGTAAKSLTDLLAGNVNGGAGQKVLLLVGLVATIVATVYVSRIAKNALEKAAGAAADSPP